MAEEVETDTRCGDAPESASPAASAVAGHPGRSAPHAPRESREPRGSASLILAFAHSRECWCVFGGYACRILAVLLMNQMLFPLFDDVFTYARDISILFSAVCMISIAVLSMNRPQLLDGKAFNRAIAVVIPFASALVVVSLNVGSAPLLVVCACLAVFCRSWAGEQADFAAVRLPLPQACLCLVFGSVAAYLADLALSLAPSAVGVALVLVVLPLTTMGLCHRYAEDLLDEIAHAEPVADVSITRPTSFLPLTSNIFVFQFIMFVVQGFALRFDEVAGVPAFSVYLALAMAIALAGYALLSSGAMSIDHLCNVALLFLFGGLLLTISGTAGAGYLANSILIMVNAVYTVLITYTLLALAGRNHLAAVAIFCWASGLGSLGTTLGALAGTTANAFAEGGSYAGVSSIVSAVALALVAYVLFGLRTFSFKDTIEGVTEPGPSQSASIVASDPESAFETRCQAISDRYGLTPREAQTFSMLARGRNREYIESALNVSRNTVKAHVKHIYAKLGIHSHQELIDLVEADVPRSE